MHSMTTFEEKRSLDETVLHQLISDLGDDPPDENSAFAALVVDYRCESRMSLEKIRQAVATDDSPLLRLAAHTLKSSSAIFGAVRLAAISRALEEMGRSGSTAFAAGLVEDAEGELQVVLRLLPFPD